MLMSAVGVVMGVMLFSFTDFIESTHYVLELCWEAVMKRSARGRLLPPFWSDVLVAGDRQGTYKRDDCRWRECIRKENKRMGRGTEGLFMVG